jgi:hypothetical protein
MTFDERKIVTECFQELVDDVEFTKAMAYADNDDTFADFNNTGMITKDGKYKAILTHITKQFLCLANAINRNPEAPTEGAEGLLSRCKDINAYTRILACMLYEDGLIEIPEAKRRLAELKDLGDPKGWDNYNPPALQAEIDKHKI